MVKLRKFKSSDKKQIALLVNNKKIWDNIRDFVPFPYSVKDAEDFIAFTQKETPQQTFGITYNELLCGSIAIEKQTDVYSHSGHLGYWIGEPFWGKGIATKACHLITQYAFKELKLHRIYSSVFDYNKGSMRVLEKCGYQREAILKQGILKNGKMHDEHIYAKLKAL